MKIESTNLSKKAANGPILKGQEISLDRLFVDPNNPRFGRDMPGYENAAAIFDASIQAELEPLVWEIYKPDELMEAILNKGWVPVDSMVAWEHPDQPDHYIVVEGNTRLTVLRYLRKKAVELQNRYDDKAKKGAGPYTLAPLKEELDRHLKVIQQTENITIQVVQASDADELEQILPDVLTVRHIARAKEWTPYAVNRYVLYAYKRLFARDYPGKPLKLEAAIIREAAKIVNMSPKKTRDAIQSVCAFSHFKDNWEHKLPDGETFRDEDQYFLVNIAEKPLVRKAFDFGKDDLQLPDEMEEVLFKWAFAKPRHPKNQNLLTRAEDFRILNDAMNYDQEHGTHFADRMDVNQPDEAEPIKHIELLYKAHNAQRSATDQLEDVIEALDRLDFKTQRAQRNHLLPLCEEIRKIAENAIRSLNSLDDPDSE